MMATTTTTTATTNGTSNTGAVATTSTLPSPFPPRYEIRYLTEADIPIASAMVIHSNTYNSGVWSKCYPTDQAQRCYDGIPAADYLVRHQINSGMSFGVFDTQYQYRDPASASKGGALLWDSSKPNATADELEAQMDSPMVSIALSYDGFNHLDMEKLGPLIALLPLYGAIFHRLGITEPRDPKTFTATAPGQILMRNATATRTRAQGQGIMSGMANWLMAFAKEKGYKHINIEAFDAKVARVWLNPKTPSVTAVQTTALSTEDYTELDEQGNVWNPFLDAKEKCCRVWVTL